MNQYKYTYKKLRIDPHWHTKFVLGFGLMMAIVCALGYAIEQVKTLS